MKSYYGPVLDIVLSIVVECPQSTIFFWTFLLGMFFYPRGIYLDKYVSNDACNLYRGLLKRVQAGSGFSGRPVSYVATHETTPPAGQVVTTDETSLLIRCLQSKKRAKSLPSTSDGAPRSGKRKADGDHQIENKRRGNDGASGSAAAVQTVYSMEALSQMTVKELQEILSRKSQPVSGKKTDLIRRILDGQ